MSDTPEELRYTKEHEWSRLEGDRIRVGITDFAQDQLGDVVYVELPPEGQTVTAGEPMGEVESTKSVSDIFCPVTGRIVEVNEALESNPALVNQDPYGEGWMVVISPEDASAYEGLLDASGYTGVLAESEGEAAP
jgi:glycine cleavage system H protein